MISTPRPSEAVRPPRSRAKEFFKRHVDSRNWLYQVLRLAHGTLVGDARKTKELRRRLFRDGVFHDEAELPMCSLLPSNVLDRVLERLAPASVLDIGCGTGQTLDYLLARGVDACGVEGSELAIRHARNGDRITRANLKKPLDLGRTFDIAWSFEVAEHIPARYADRLVRACTRHANTVVMSAAPPGQGGEGHLNEQPPQYWVTRFNQQGFALDPELTQYLSSSLDPHAKNILVFRRRHN